jgi:hypothetical protein
MSADATVHEVLLGLSEPVAPEVPVASDIVLKVTTSCACGCDLGGRLVMLMSGEKTVIASVHDEFAVNIPKELGAYSWTLVFPRQEIRGTVHEHATLPIVFATKPVATSLAVWDVPSPVVTGAGLRVKVGAKSSIACTLKGATVEFLDDAGGVVGRGQLGDTPWEGTTALYWTEVELVAPASAGIVCWTARFAGADTELAHGEGVAQFSFAVVQPADHRLTIRLIEKETEKPIENAHVRLGPFRSLTDASGVAELSMPKGTYELKVWHTSYETPPTVVEITDDLTVQLLGVAVPEEDPSARFMM